MSPRLPSGAPLVVAVAATAATIMVAAPAAAGPVTHAAAAGSAAAGRARVGTAAGDKIRNTEWWLSRLHVAQAWQSSRGAGVTVALLSTGVLTSHPDLAGSVTTGPDFTGSGETSASSTWGIEGTSAASIIAAHGDNTGGASGLIGIAPAARILSIRVAFDAADALNASSSAVGRLPGAIAEGIRYAVAHGAKVIDLPLDPATLASDGAATGGLAAAAGGSAAERSAVSYAIGQGVVLVAPAGDNGADGNTASFPASYPGVIALGAVDKQSDRADFSTRQSYVALTAPGVGVTAASRPAGYRNMSTTDAASAMVAGIAALIRSRYPSLTSAQVRQALLTGSASPPAAGTAGDGAGTVDALKAVRAAAAIASPRPTARPSTPVATVPAPVRPLTSHPRPGTVGMARSALRDAAAAAGGLIVLMLGILLGLRLWRRRSGQETHSAPEPRTLLGAPSGPPSGPLPIQPSNARHARALAAEPVFAPAAPPAVGPVPAGAPGSGPRLDVGQRPDFMSPRFAPADGMPAESDRPDEAGDEAADPGPAGRSRIRNRGRAGHSGPATRIGPHNLRPRVTPAAHTATRDQVSAPGGPPWEPAPAPEDEQLHEPRSPVHEQFGPPARPAPPAPAAGAPWDVTALGPPAAAAGPPGLPPAGDPGRPRRDPGPAGVPAPPAGPAAPPLADRTRSADGPGTPSRPISPLDRLPLPEPGRDGSRPPLGPPGGATSAGPPPDPAGPPAPPAPPAPWRVPGTSGRFPGAGNDREAAPAPPAWPQDAYPGRTGRLSRPGEFLPPYAGRPSREDEPEPGPAPEGPQPARDRGAGKGPGDSPSGPLYIWNPAALTEPFPAGPERGHGDDDDPDPRRRA